MTWLVFLLCCLYKSLLYIKTYFFWLPPFLEMRTLIVLKRYIIEVLNIDFFFDFYFDFWCFNATFSNISAISWRPVLVVEEAGVPGENHRPRASNWYTLSLAAASRVHPFCTLQSQARTHAVLVICLYELLGNPTT